MVSETTNVLWRCLIWQIQISALTGSYLCHLSAHIAMCILLRTKQLDSPEQYTIEAFVKNCLFKKYENAKKHYLYTHFFTVNVLTQNQLIKLNQMSVVYFPIASISS